jgi:hypothetical protein
MSYEMQICQSAPAETRMAVHTHTHTHTHTHLAGCLTPCNLAQNIGFLFQISNIFIEEECKFDVKMHDLYQ